MTSRDLSRIPPPLSLPKTTSLVLALSTLLLASCGGGDSQSASASGAEDTKTAQAVPPGWGGRAPKYEVINGITVPPEPAPTINNATLAGVDVNGNGVRDDLERWIAQTVSDKTAVQVSYSIIANRQSVIGAPTPPTAARLQDLQRAETCWISELLNNGNADVASQFATRLLNTDQRKLAYRRNMLNRQSYSVDIADICK